MDHPAALFLACFTAMTGIAAIVFALIVRPARRRT
jgi:hypothetical protein